MPFTEANIKGQEKRIRELISPDDVVLNNCCCCGRDLTIAEIFMERRTDANVYCLYCFAKLSYNQNRRYHDLRSAGFNREQTLSIISIELAGKSKWIKP